MTPENLEHKRRFAPKGKVKVIQGSITSPHGGGLHFILNIATLAGKTDKNPLYPIFDKRWRQVKQDAKLWWINKNGQYKLGAVNQTVVQSDAWVLHMLCQDEEGEVSLPGLNACLKEVCKQAIYEHASVHVSQLLVEAIPELPELLNKHLVDEGVSVFYYQG
jgi:hypothetical protein